MSKVVCGGVPAHSQLSGRQTKRGFSDSLSFSLDDPHLSPAQVYVNIFGQLPAVVTAMMALRNWLVRPLGFAVSPEPAVLSVELLEQGKSDGLHQVEWLSDEEIICTSQDRHMLVSLSLLKSGLGQFTLSTIVNPHSWLGYIYLLAIIPFHKVIALTSVRSAIKRAEG